jgi:hypothetical protein
MTDLAANLIAVLHLAYFIFIVAGTVAILVRPRPSWVLSWRFRLTHLLSVYVVLAENLLNVPCPLNVVQWSLRSSAGGTTEAIGGLGALLDWLLFHTISGDTLDALYLTLGILLPLLLVVVPPNYSGGRGQSRENLEPGIAIQEGSRTTD